MRQGIAFILLGLLGPLLTVSPTLAETVGGSIGGADRVYTFVADTSQSARVIAMWAKGSSDLDLFVFFLDAEEPLLVAASEATGERLELTEFGLIGNGLYSVVLARYSGGRTKFTLNVSSMGSELVSFAGEEGSNGRGLDYLGGLASLATEDPYFAAIEIAVARHKAVKRRLR